MRRLALALSFAFGCGGSLALPADPSAVLAELAKTMADVRADPAKASRARCPGTISAVVGQPVGRIVIELGQPPQASSGNTLNYSFVTFKFDDKGNVTSVECRVAK